MATDFRKPILKILDNLLFERSEANEKVATLERQLSDLRLVCDSQKAALDAAETKHVRFMVKGGPVVMASEYDALKAKLDWALIDEKNQPQIGDEVGGYFTTPEMTTWEVTSVDCMGDWTAHGYTHFRPQNAPLPPAPKEA